MSRIQDVITSLKSPSQLTREMLGAAATTLAAGYLGGTQGVEAVGKIATMKKQLGDQRRLDKIAEAKRKMEEDRNRLEMEQIQQQTAESKARVTREDEYKKAAGENLKDQQFNRAAKTGLESAKMMMQGMGLGGGRGGRYRSSGTGKAPTVKASPRPPLVPSSATPEERTKAYEKHGLEIARGLIDKDVFRSYQEFQESMPQLMKTADYSSLSPDDMATVDREMKMHFARTFRPDLADRSAAFRATREGLEPPPSADFDSNNMIPATLGTMGAVFGMALPGGPFTSAALAAGGTAVGNEIAKSLPKDYIPGLATALAKYLPSPGTTTVNQKKRTLYGRDRL